jgi:signal transduction histidine kinase
MKWLRRTRRLDLQAKISLVLVGVIVPTFLVVTVAENKITRPILTEEMRQVGVVSGKTLATEIVSQKLLQLPNPTPAIESYLQELLYLQPNIVRMDVAVKDPITGQPRIIATNVEDDPLGPPPAVQLVETVSDELRTDEFGVDEWVIHVPIEVRRLQSTAPKRVLGVVRVVVSMKFINRILETIWRTTATAAAITVVALIVALSYFLRKTISNDRLLRRVESLNLELSEQLQDAQRQLMNTEKLAVMGQLTASFAHEIGTPLNALGGHFQLLQEELDRPSPERSQRLQIIHGQIQKIADIVKNFMQSTAKPASQRQLVDLNRIAEQTLAIVAPRLESAGVEARRNLDRSMGPLRVVPLDLEQILLNLVNNSIDSLRSKGERGRRLLEVESRREADGQGDWAVLSVYDTGQGIRRSDLEKVLKPFYTTKPPGHGTGLGLTICQDLARKYGGSLEIDSKEGAWTRVTLRMPYQGNA